MILYDNLSLFQFYMYMTIAIVTTVIVINFVFYDIEFVCVYTSFLDFVILLIITLTFKTNFFPEPYHSILDCVLIVIVSPVLYKIALYQIFFVKKLSSTNALPL